MLAPGGGNHGPQVVAVTSGKGGVGKSTVSINLAIALAQAGKRVVLVDVDLGLANIDIMLGLRPTHNLSHVLAGECQLSDIIMEGPAGIRVIPSSSGLREMAELGDRERAGIIYAFSALADDADVVLLDTAAGISGNTTQFCTAAQDVLVVVCNEPASIADAYATIKVLNQYGRNRFRVLVNMANSPADAADLFQKLVTVTDRFLNVTLELTGTIPRDAKVSEAARKRESVTLSYPSTPAAVAFKKLAMATDKWPRPSVASGALEFFVEQLVQPSAMGRHAQA
ncbi:MAG: MinD/ParA family protein [Gammaproteobacteria bacterium]|nr:MinD/ParA family protein [Gammaproteobacteria bacterium]